jgi:hypothetical protein
MAVRVSRESFDMQDLQVGQLRAFDRTVAKELCKRDAVGVMEAIAGTAQKSALLLPGVQQAVDSLALLMATAKQQGSKSRVEAWMLLVLTLEAGLPMKLEGK